MGFTVQHRVNHVRFQPGVPGTTGFGCPRVNFRSGKGDLSRVAQHRFTQRPLFGLGGNIWNLGFDHVHDGAQ
ncbi:hypothetical protein N6V40_12415 [Glutamicibacter sp. M10]|nr:hypothetical protein [Glutamicibacter sp. M10]UXN31198.1 hypothetical protein N6V40_12415 [Glutamicibacter sp. M10]